MAVPPAQATSNNTTSATTAAHARRRVGGGSRGGSGGSAEDDGSVGTAKAEAVRKREADPPLLRRLRHPIDHALPARRIQIERGWGHAVPHGHDGEDRLDRTGGAQQMAGRRFGG